VLIFYVDESGHHSANRDPEDPSKLAPGSSELFVLGAAGIRDTSRKSLAQELVRVKRVHFGDLVDTLDWNATEIKGRHIAVARKRFTPDAHQQELPAGYAVFSTPERLDDFEDDLRLIFARYRPIVFTIVIDKTRLKVRPGQSALEWAYAFLYRRVALTLQRMFDGEGGVFVADQQAEHENTFNAGRLMDVRDGINQGGKRRAEYERILDKPLWIDTKLSSWDREIIQLADIAAFLASEAIKGGKPPRNAELWAELRRCMAVRADTGEPDGEGLVIFPKPDVWPLTS